MIVALAFILDDEFVHELAFFESNKMKKFQKSV